MLKIYVLIFSYCLVGFQADSACDENWVDRPFSDSCYFFSENTANSNDAQTACTSFGGHLVSIITSEEQLFIQSIDLTSYYTGFIQIKIYLIILNTFSLLNIG